MKNHIRKFAISAVIWSLTIFMLFIFLPSEAFFANAGELQFIYGEFIWSAIMIFAVTSILISFIVTFLPDTIYRIVNSLIFGIGLCSYIQNMFLNKGLDLMGQNPDGYKAESGKALINIVIWLVMIGVVLVISLKTKKDGIYAALAAFLIAIQAVALVSLIINADEGCFEYPKSEYHLSGAQQLEVSSDENIIMFVVDCFSDLDLKNALSVNPDALVPFRDFTFYTNMDCCFLGTFPSMTHMLTNIPVNFETTVNGWTNEAWSSTKCGYFYSEMKKKGYECNLYTPDLSLLCAGNDYRQLLEGKWDNFNDAPLRRDADRKRILKTMVKMALYKMTPEYLKPNFYVDMSEYSDSVKVLNDPIMHENYDFKESLEANGLSKNGEHKKFIVQHLMGTHLFSNDEFGNYKEGAGYEETALGALYVVNEYLEELKRIGAYDNSVIIITADHGWAYGQQPVFFIKDKKEKNEDMPENSAPVSFRELLPTIAMKAGIDPSPIGETIYDYEPGQLRERTLYIREYREEYPDVPYYDGTKTGTANVYLGYTYTGDEDELLKYLFDYPSEIIPMVDSFF